MKLTTHKRTDASKSHVKSVRREGNIPAVLYSKEGGSVQLNVNGAEFGAAMRQIKKGGLATTRFTLIVDGKEHKALIKEVQYEPTTYNVIHLDFLELHEKTLVKLNVPIKFDGVVDCEGIKLGGVLRQVIRTASIKCLPKDIPSSFTIDVRDLGLGGSKRIKDIPMPAGVTCMAPPNEVAVVIAKR